MAIQAVIFDFGKVLSAPADPQCHAELCRLTSLAPERFEELYWEQPDRRAYDIGGMTGLEYWQRFAARLGLDTAPEFVAQLTEIDARMWSTENPPVIAWSDRLRRQGVQTAILSNMGDAIAAKIEATLPWVQRFDARVWSFRLKFGKPQPESYRFVLSQLQRKPEETLFLDDRPANVEAAAALGLATHLFTTVEALSVELKIHATQWALPLPE